MRRLRLAFARRPVLVAFVPSLAALLGVALAAGVAGSETRWHMESDPGEYVGGGLTYDLVPADGTFTLVPDATYGTAATFQSSTQFWRLTFSAPNLAPLAPGLYENAPRLPFFEPERPALDLGGNGRGCNQSLSTFRVKHVVYGAGGAIESLWLTFDHHCEAGPRALRGDLRWNYDPAVIAESPWNASADVGQLLAFSVRGSAAGAVALEAVELPAGAAFADSGNGGGGFTWQPSWSQVGRHRATFVAREPGGAVDTTSTTIVVHGSTLLRLESEPGEYILEGASRNFTTATGSFGASLQGTSLQILWMGYQGAAFGESWSIEVAVPEGPIQAGTYEIGLQAYPFLYNTGGAYVRGDLRSGSAMGLVHLKQLERAPDGTIASCWVRFELHVDGNTPALSGEFRYNAVVPVEVEAPFRRVADSMQLLEIPVSATSAEGSPLELTAVDPPPGASFLATGPAAGTLSWIPLVEQEDVHVLRFAASDGLGHVDTTWTVVHVRGLRLLRIDSPFGEWIGGGEMRRYEAGEARFTARPTNFQNGLTVEVVSLAGQPTFTLEFYPPEGDTLRPGRYPNATNAYPRPPGTPGLEIHSTGRGCSRYEGAFTITELDRGPFGIERFRATFEQRCDAGPALHGEVRVDARAWVALEAPFVHRGTHGEPLVFEMNATDRRGGPLTLDVVSVPAGGMLVDDGSGHGTFSWTPPLGTIGRFDAVFAATGAGGATDTAAVAVLVGGDRAFSYVSPSGDPIGGGTSRGYGAGDGRYAATHSEVFGTTGTFQPESLSSAWSFTVDAPGDLVPGFYTGAFEYTPGGPRLRIVSPVSASYCGDSPGRFEVKQLEREPNGDVRSLWLRVAKRCNPQSPGFSGEIQVDAFVQVRTVAPAFVTREIGRPALVAVAGRNRDGTPAELWMTDLPDGATFADYGDGTGALGWTPRDDQLGRYLTVLHARGLGGAEDSTMIEIEVTGRSRFVYTSEGPDDPVGQGTSGAFGPDDGIFTAFAEGNGVSLYFAETVHVGEGDPATELPQGRSVTLFPPAGTALEPGIYTARGWYALFGSPFGGLRVQLLGNSCDEFDGAFRVRSVRVAGDVVEEIDADYEQTCVGADHGLRGSILYRAPRTFRAEASILRVVEAGDSVRIGVGASGEPGPFSFEVLGLPSGAVFAPAGPDGAELNWETDADAIGIHDVRFVAIAADGRRDTVTSRIRVLGETRFAIVSSPGDPVGGGESVEYCWRTARWEVFPEASDIVYANVTPRLFAPAWEVLFGAPLGTELVPGVYENAVHPARHYTQRDRPILFVQRQGSPYCIDLVGRFEVKALRRGAEGIDMLWVTFEQRCHPDSAPLTGEIRYNLDVSVPALVSVVETSASDRGVRVTWQLGAAAKEVAIERRAPGMAAWTEVARAMPDGVGRIVYEDAAVEPGSRYGYRLALDAGARGGETWIEVPLRVTELTFDGARPNPTASGVVASFAIPRPGPVRLELLDVSGRRVALRDEPSLAAGRHALPLAPAGSLHPGVYLMKLTWGGRTMLRRVSVVR